MSWERVEEWMPNAKAIAWDTCHKIYLLMDDEQVEQMRGYGYDPIYSIEELGVEVALQEVNRWFDKSCGLRFIEAVKTNKQDPNAGFTSLIAQFEFEDMEEEDE